jgi:hypothetical protein
MRCAVKILVLLAGMAAIPTAASAQAVIAGTVRDSSGAVLGRRRSRSPALIEKVAGR